MKPLAPLLQQVDRTCVRYHGRKLTYFGGCDYFRLASHPRILRATADGLERFGLNVAASRMTTGNHQLYEELENALTRFFNAESALLVSNGYVTNLVVAQALAGSFSHALIDERAHASLGDAVRFLDCPVIRFRHRNVGDVVRIVKRLGRSIRPILLTDGLFSRDGSAAPLSEYLKSLPHDAWLLVDDSHGAGLLGDNGRGTLEHLGVPRSRILQSITLSKAFGVYGGAVLCERRVRERIVARSRLFAGSTPLPLPLACAALQAVKVLQTDQGLRARLWRNVDFVKTALRKKGLPVPDFPGPIISMLPRSDSHTATVRRHLLARDIYPSFIRYPGGSGIAFFRFVISSEHGAGQLKRLVDALDKSQGR